MSILTHLMQRPLVHLLNNLVLEHVLLTPQLHKFFKLLLELLVCFPDLRQLTGLFRACLAKRKIFRLEIL